MLKKIASTPDGTTPEHKNNAIIIAAAPEALDWIAEAVKVLDIIVNNKISYCPIKIRLKSLLAQVGK
jgi:hypothetical protein